ncbi:hypothetical protein G9A89_003984 [Geosiphon pyriformis]|nr:hypothetical protein G9A89_003984 [Geosiphon pyriformis]
MSKAGVLLFVLTLLLQCSAPISCSVSFGGTFWANIIGGSSFSPLSAHNGSAASGFSLEMKPTLQVFLELNNKFAALEHSLASFTECVDKLAKRLDSPGPAVSQLSPGYQLLVTPLSQDQEVDVVICKDSDIATSGGIVADAVGFDASVISKIEKTLKNLSVTVISLLAKMENDSSVPAIRSSQ